MTTVARISPFLHVRDLAETIAFYTTHLGLTVVASEPPDRPSFVILEARDRATGASGGATIMFATGLWQGPPTMTGQVHIDLGDQGREPSRVLAIVESLRGSCEILWGPEVYWYGRRECSVRDPNGYAVVLSEASADPVTDAGP